MNDNYVLIILLTELRCVLIVWFFMDVLDVFFKVEYSVSLNLIDLIIPFVMHLCL